MRTIKLLLVLLLIPISVLAQKNELGVLAGGYVPLGTTTLDTGPGVAVQGVFAHRVAGVPFLAAYVELPVTAGFNLRGRSTFTAANYSTLFVTPGLKLKLAPGFPISPYFVVGGGYGRFHVSSGGTSTTENKAVADIGGGLDMKIAPFVSLRGEVRDYRSGTPRLLGLGGLSGHNLVGGGGIVLRF